MVSRLSDKKINTIQQLTCMVTHCLVSDSKDVGSHQWHSPNADEQDPKQATLPHLSGS